MAILGPFTLVLPWLIVAATAWATPLATTWHAAFVMCVSSAAILLHDAHSGLPRMLPHTAAATEVPFLLHDPHFCR